MKLTLDLPMQLKGLGESGEFSAVAWDYAKVDRHGDMILPGAFDKSLTDHAELGSMPAMLWQHKGDEPIGAWLGLEDTGRGLEAHGKLELSIPRAAEAYALLKSRALSLSIGFQAKASDVYSKDGIRYFKGVDLTEISLVSVPANPGAVVRSVKCLSDCESPRDFEGLVRDALGLSRRQAKTLTGLAWPALSGRDGEEAEEQEQDLAAVAAQIKNITALIQKR